MSLKIFLRDALINALGLEPTACQVKMFDRLAEFISDKEYEDGIMLINGYAGTGKTSAISALVRLLKEHEQKYVLMAPTGRSAKVLSGYTGHSSYTVHKQIYRQKSLKDGIGSFVLDINRNKDTIFIVDEASLISSGTNETALFGSGNLLDDLVKYVRMSSGNRLILIGDSAQLPPVGEEISNALNPEYLKRYGEVMYVQLKSVVRQVQNSGILYNATLLRQMIENYTGTAFPNFEIEKFSDIERIRGDELIEKITGSFDKYSADETIILCRSNKRANRYNQGIRSKILYREERINRGDKLMVVKNCYQFSDQVEEIEFIANGDIAELIKISNYEERYGLNFAKAILSFPDYGNLELEARIILDTLESESASLNAEQQKALFEGVMEDYAHIKQKRKRVAAVREDAYYNALQIKYAHAITCHKSQGGQWKAVFIDNPFWKESVTKDDLKWLYTALTRATNKIYFINFGDNYFITKHKY